MNDFSERHVERFRTLLLETLSTFGRINENFIDLIVAIFHYIQEIEAGQICISQGAPYSLTWEVIMLELEREGWVSIEQKGYREYALKKTYTQTGNYKDILEELKKRNYNEIRELTFNLMKNNNQKTNIDSLKNLLDMQRVSSTS